MLIEFIVNGDFYATRRWDSCPRIGEHVLLNNNCDRYKVTNVIWGDEEQSNPLSKLQWVQVICERVEVNDR